LLSTKAAEKMCELSDDFYFHAPVPCPILSSSKTNEGDITMNQSWEMQVFTYYRNGILRFIQLGDYLNEKGFRPIEAIRMVFRFISKFTGYQMSSERNETALTRSREQEGRALSAKERKGKVNQSLKMLKEYINTG
jgi:hypothetical protein